MFLVAVTMNSHDSKGFPVLFQRTNSTLYVHSRFLGKYNANREISKDFCGPSGAVDLDRIRMGISNLLMSSTNQILKIRDCCHLMKMTTQQSTKSTQRRFFFQLHLMEDAGYVRRVRVPGSTSGSLIRCVQLVKRYSETDANFTKSDQQSHGQANVQELNESVDGLSSALALDAVSADELEEDNDEIIDSKAEVFEDLDMSAALTTSGISEGSQTQIVRGMVLELQISQTITAAGAAGMSGPKLRRDLVDNYWIRPFDEIIKRLCPDLPTTTQPVQYSSLSVGPAVEEVSRKTRQFRYYSVCNLPNLPGFRKYHEHVSVNDGLMPAIPADSISRCLPLRSPFSGAIETRGRGREAAEILAENSSKQGITQRVPKSKILKKNARPTKAVFAERGHQGQSEAGLAPRPIDDVSITTSKIFKAPRRTFEEYQTNTMELSNPEAKRQKLGVKVVPELATNPTPSIGPNS